MFLNDKLKALWSRMEENIKKKKAARLRIWNNFCDETPLQGFLIYRNSHFRYERAIWLLLVFAAIGVTLNDSVRTIGQFMDEEILSKVAMVQNESIILPNPTVCLSLKFLQPSVDLLDNASAVQEFLRRNSQKILHIFGPLVAKQNETDEYGVDNASRYLMKDSNVSLPLFEIILMALKTAQYADLNIKYNSSDMRTRDMGGHWNVTACVFRFLDENQLNYFEVAKATASYLCKLIDPIVFNVHLSLIDWCNRHYAVHCDESVLCFRPPLLPAVFTFTEDSNFAIVETHSRISRYTVVDYFSLKFDRNSDPYASANTLVISSTEAQSVEVEVDITTTQFHPTSKSPCDKTDHYIDCEENCKNDMIKEHCGCVRISSFYINCPDVVVCRDVLCLNGTYYDRENSYLAPLKCIETIEGDLKMCSHKCLKSCALLTLQFRTTAHPITHGGTGSILLMTVPRKSYLSIEQSLAMDTQTFMSNLGGNLGLYIGGTFLALIHLFTSVIRLIVSLLVAKEDTQVEQVESNELQHSLSELDIAEIKRNAVLAQADISILKANMAALQERLLQLQ